MHNVKLAKHKPSGKTCTDAHQWAATDYRMFHFLFPSFSLEESMEQNSSMQSSQGMHSYLTHILQTHGVHWCGILMVQPHCSAFSPSLVPCFTAPQLHRLALPSPEPRLSPLAHH